MFVDPENGYYYLQDGSPCIDAGTADGAPSDDIEGNPREGLPDMGAYEYGSNPYPKLIAYTPDPTNNTMPTLTWFGMSGVSGYHIQIDNDDDFSSPIVDDSSVTESTYTPALPLPVGRRKLHQVESL